MQEAMSSKRATLQVHPHSSVRRAGSSTTREYRPTTLVSAAETGATMAAQLCQPGHACRAQHRGSGHHICEMGHELFTLLPQKLEALSLRWRMLGRHPNAARWSWLTWLACAAVVGLFLGATSSSVAAQSCSDPSRTIHITGSSACRVYDGDAASCAQAWALTQGSGQAVSCFYSSGTCQGCGPNNQASGACVNACAPRQAVPALPPVALVAAFVLLLACGATRTTAGARTPCQRQRNTSSATPI
jgi:hypothetical protein